MIKVLIVDDAAFMRMAYTKSVGKKTVLRL